MKKFFTVLFIFLSLNFISAQESVKSANRNTALRCLKLAENCLAGGDWDNAVKQAELGLSYDDHISDLLYLKAAANINLGGIKSEIIDIISKAFEIDEWVGYSKNGARILYADLLSDTGSYDQSMNVLDSKPMLYSADAEFIRIKNYYRMGTENSINSARIKLSTVRRVYPSDSRFPSIFFMFEFLYLLENEKYDTNYQIPEIVQSLADFYLKKLPDYSGEHTDMEILAVFFANSDDKKRLVDAIDAKQQTENPVMALAGLETGRYDQQTACDLFFKFSDGSISLTYLEALIHKISDTSVKTQLMDRMLNFEGTINIDENYDLQNEIVVTYETGRPVSIEYDKNNDGIIDLYSSCDFGSPDYVFFEQNKTELYYDSYPSVSKLIFKDKQYSLNFLQDDFCFSPFVLQSDDFIKNLGIDFYIPYFDGNILFPDEQTITVKSSSVEVPVGERDNASALYTTLNGTFISVSFYESGKKYAYCDFSSTYPIQKHTDNDLDGYFETVELYNTIDKTSSLYDRELIADKFGNIFADYPLYLQKVLIDRNGNTFYEFCEEYLENNGKICCWDNNDDGIVDCKYVKDFVSEYPSIREETVFYNNYGEENLVLNMLNGIPVKITNYGSEVLVSAGNTSDFYWIDEPGNDELEELVLQNVSGKLEQGKTMPLVLNDKKLSVILVGKTVYCRILQEYEMQYEEQD